MAPPAEKLVIQIPMAVDLLPGVLEQDEDQRQRGRGQVAPAIPSRARLAISCSGLAERAASTDSTFEGGAQQQQPAAPGSGRQGSPW